MKIIKNSTRSVCSIGLCLLFAVTLLFTNVVPVKADATSDETSDTILTIGADLTDKERKTVYDLLGIDETDIEKDTVLSITNQDEHNYLDDYLSANVIGKRALSSIKLVKTSEGSGLHVETKNINYCTDSMYINALATAGVKDADVTVAGPFEISGTAALVGVMKAYEKISGTQISEEVKDAATDELVTTGEISDSIGDADKASELIGYIKNEVVNKNATSPEDIDQIVTDAAKELNINLSDADKQKIVDSMQKISKLDLDPNTLKEQAKSLYDKLGDLNISLSKDQVKDISENASNFFDKFLEFFKSIYNKIVNAFS